MCGCVYLHVNVYFTFMDLKKYRNKVEMKERKKTAVHQHKYTVDVEESYVFYLCLVSVPFSGPSILEAKFCTNFPYSFCSFSGGS